MAANNLESISEKFDVVFKFISELILYNHGAWVDNAGFMNIDIGKGILSKELRKLRQQFKCCYILASTEAREILKLSQYDSVTRNYRYMKNLDCFASIGGAREHNSIRELVLAKYNDLNIYYLTAPTALTNDAFCTNRSSPCFDQIKIPSRQSVYPSRIIIDLELIKSIGNELNIYGVGELVGLYYSMRDYYSTKKYLFIKKIICKIHDNIQNQMVTSKTIERHDFNKLLAINLLMKCLIMRANGDHQIGTGGDHLISYALRCSIISKIKWVDLELSHGQLVYLGSMIMAALFPEWDYHTFSIKGLLDMGISLGLLNDKVFHFLLSEFRPSLIRLALKMRPVRSTILSDLSEKQIKSAMVRIMKYI